jgi:hypothetical protein
MTYRSTVAGGDPARHFPSSNAGAQRGETDEGARECRRFGYGGHLGDAEARRQERMPGGAADHRHVAQEAELGAGIAMGRSGSDLRNSMISPVRAGGRLQPVRCRTHARRRSASPRPSASASSFAWKAPSDGAFSVSGAAGQVVPSRGTVGEPRFLPPPRGAPPLQRGSAPHRARRFRRTVAGPGFAPRSSHGRRHLSIAKDSLRSAPSPRGADATRRRRHRPPSVMRRQLIAQAAEGRRVVVGWGLCAQQRHFPQQ